ncbi:MAG: SRPBCC domain-containing protein [Candidatus Eisenbacteria bacterium]|nr:SRPBCC domain-containing protein [Candidatus Eisenbacteria bacterium]MCC7141426.1 SRPBCC domain-containing protein [Candidatus Eisenbacteria bacterium]
MRLTLFSNPACASLAFAALATLISVLGAAAAVSAAEDGPIVAEGVIDAPIAEVWNAWATSEGLAAWLAPQADIDLRVDGLMRANYDPKGALGDAGTIENRILSFEPERMLSIRVAKAPESFPFKAKVGEMWTVLYFQPAETKRTALRIVGLGFGADEESRRMREFFQQGNAFTLEQLRKHFQK